MSEVSRSSVALVMPQFRVTSFGLVRSLCETINISSDTPCHGAPMLLHYVASKGAIFAFTRVLARELSGTEINVNTMTPAFTLTEVAHGIADPETVAQIRAGVLEQQVIKRSEVPSAMARTVVFLASDDSDSITGQTINVNGGATHL